MRYFISIIISLTSLSVSAQLFNFAIKTNNQQIIDEALSGAFVKLTQSYELNDTVTKEHFGRNGKDYFSQIPFIGVETEEGTLFTKSVINPWELDIDFSEYEGKYKPQITQTDLVLLNEGNTYANKTIDFSKVTEKAKNFIILKDTIQAKKGLKLDSIYGEKRGWFVWLTSDRNLLEVDSVKLLSIKKDIEVPINGEALFLSDPDINENIIGGFYLTPTQTEIGQITFILTGVILRDANGWKLEFPAIQEHKEKKKLTPINSLDEDKLKQLKKKRK